MGDNCNEELTEEEQQRWIPRAKAHVRDCGGRVMDCFQVLMQDHLIDVYGPQANAPDLGGGDEVTWPVVRQSGVQCLINAPMLGVQDRFSQDNLIGTVQIATFYIGIQRGDLLVVTKGPPYVGAQMRVTGFKEQPGVEVLGFFDASPIVHAICEHVQVNV